MNNVNIFDYGIKIIFFCIILIISFATLIRVDTYLKNDAINKCGVLSRFETTTKDSKVAYPVQEVYSQCLKDKGIEK